MAVCRSMEDQNRNSNSNINDSFVLAQQQSYFYQTLEERAPPMYKNTPSCKHLFLRKRNLYLSYYFLVLSSSTSKEIKKAVFNNYHGKPMVSSRTQKKFVCKILSNNDNSLQELPKRYICLICGKRFVRPGSLTTHTYSHTGEVI